jgi:hypothetical protein
MKCADMRLSTGARLRSQQDANDKRQRAYGLAKHFEEDRANWQIARHAPRFMHDAVDALQERIDFLGGTVRFWTKQSRVGSCFIEAACVLRRKCEAGQDKIRAMMYDLKTPLDEQRKRCAAIVEECVALTRPHLEGDRAWLRHQDRKERAKAKTT